MKLDQLTGPDMQAIIGKEIEDTDDSQNQHPAHKDRVLSIILAANNSLAQHLTPPKDGG